MTDELTIKDGAVGETTKLTECNPASNIAMNGKYGPRGAGAINFNNNTPDLLQQCKAALYRAKCIMDAYDGTKLPEVDAALKALSDAGVK